MDNSVRLTAMSGAALVRQTSAALVHPTFFSVWNIEPWTIVRIATDTVELATWLVPADGHVLESWAKSSWATSIWLSQSLGIAVGLSGSQKTEVVLSFNATHMGVQPARIDNYIQTHQTVLSLNDRRSFLKRSKYVLVVSPARTMAVKPLGKRQSRKQRDGLLRLNFHARTLLGVGPSQFEGRSVVQLSEFAPNHDDQTLAQKLLKITVGIARAPSVALELIARFFLRAPLVTLASEESSTSDDTHGVVRVSSNTCDLLGIESGDQVFVSWGGRKVLARAYQESSWEYDQNLSSEIIDWTPSRRSQHVGADSRIAVPAKLRVELGAPRNSILVVRRSLVSRLRRRLISLTIPMGAIVFSILRLGLTLPMAVALAGFALFFTLFGERVPRTSWMKWP